MTTAQSNRMSPPYVAFRTFINFLDWLEQEGMPQRFDRSVWGRRLSGTYGAQMMGAFRFLGLTGLDDNPTDRLGQLVFNREQRKVILRQVLRNSYPTVPERDLLRITTSQLQGRFRDLGVQGDTLRKSVTFFLHAYTYCEVPLGPYLAKAVKGRGVIKRQARGERVDQPVETGSAEPLNLHPVLMALLRQLRDDGSSWSIEQQDRWLTTFAATIRMLFPTTRPQEST